MAHKAQYVFFSFLLPTISVYVILGVYKISYKFTHLKKHISIQPWRFPGPPGATLGPPCFIPAFPRDFPRHAGAQWHAVKHQDLRDVAGR